MTALIHEALETWQGRCAYRNGVPREANPYHWTPNSRQGDAKRAKWELGWDTEASTDCRYTITDKGRELLENAKK